MVYVRLPYKLIEGVRRRNEVFKWRRVMVKRMAMELGKIFDVVTLLVCFGPRGQLETWPEDTQEVRRIIDQYRIPKKEDGDKSVKHRYDMSSFFECHLNKLQGELARARKSRLGNPSVTVQALEELAWSLDAKLTAIDQGIAGGREEESWGKEINDDQVLGQQQQIQLQQIAEDTPPPPLQDLFQCIEGLDFSWLGSVILDGEGLEGHAATAAGAAWGDLQGLPRSEMPWNQYSMADPSRNTPLSIADYGFSVDSSYPDDITSTNSLLTMDCLVAYPAAAAPGTLGSSNMVDVPSPTWTAFPQPPCHDGFVGYNAGDAAANIRNNNAPADSSGRALDGAGYESLLEQLPAEIISATTSKQQEYYQNEQLHGAGYFQWLYNTGHARGQTWFPSTDFA